MRVYLSVTMLTVTRFVNRPKMMFHTLPNADLLDFDSQISQKKKKGFVQEIWRCLLTTESLDTFTNSHQKTHQQFLITQETIGGLYRRDKTLILTILPSLQGGW